MTLMLSGSCHPILFGIQWQPKILKALNVQTVLAHQETLHLMATRALIPLQWWLHSVTLVQQFHFTFHVVPLLHTNNRYFIVSISKSGPSILLALLSCVWKFLHYYHVYESFYMLIAIRFFALFYSSYCRFSFVGIFFILIYLWLDFKCFTMLSIWITHLFHLKVFFYSRLHLLEHFLSFFFFFFFY